MTRIVRIRGRDGARVMYLATLVLKFVKGLWKMEKWRTVNRNKSSNVMKNRANVSKKKHLKYCA